MLEDDIYITGSSQAVLELLRLISGQESPKKNSLLQKCSEIFGNISLISLKMRAQYDKSQFPAITS